MDIEKAQRNKKRKSQKNGSMPGSKLYGFGRVTFLNSLPLCI
jgi:hypothetical protein